MIERREKQVRRKVLLIDDDELIRGLMKLYLTGLGQFDYSEAWDGKAGLALAKRMEPDLIIADLMMPTMNGIEFTRELRKSGTPSVEQIPVIIVTGASDELKTEALTAGATFVLEKPLSRKVMVAVFDRIFPAKVA